MRFKGNKFAVKKENILEIVYLFRDKTISFIDILV